jgi:hypothetical protein
VSNYKFQSYGNICHFGYLGTWEHAAEKVLERGGGVGRLGTAEGGVNWAREPLLIPPRSFDWIERIENSTAGGKFFLGAGTFLIDRQYQLPPGTEIHGARSAHRCRKPGGCNARTIIQAVGPPFDKNCGVNASNRKGFLLNDNTYIGGFHYIGSETARYGATVQLPCYLACITAQLNWMTTGTTV